MTRIYDQHDAAFRSVSAFVLLDKDGERVATVAIKFPKDGAARLWAYVHLIGSEMVRGYANGYGYDKRSAAVSAAFDALPAASKLRALAPAMDSRDWVRVVESAGYRVIQAA